jgi:hypothetical protein
LKGDPMATRREYQAHYRQVVAVMVSALLLPACGNGGEEESATSPSSVEATTAPTPALAEPTTAPSSAPAATATTVPQAQAPDCAISWGSLAKIADSTEVALLTNVRADQHACFDRLVLDYAGHTDGFQVQYVSAIRGVNLPAPPVDLRGDALLEIVVQTPYGEDEPAFSTSYSPSDPRELVDVAGWQTFRQVSLVEVYEDQVALGLGVRALLPFRVFTLDGPGPGSRIVIDVAHGW